MQIMIVNGKSQMMYLINAHKDFYLSINLFIYFIYLFIMVAYGSYYSRQKTTKEKLKYKDSIYDSYLSTAYWQLLISYCLMFSAFSFGYNFLDIST
jgi:hypothetical protein